MDSGVKEVKLSWDGYSDSRKCSIDIKKDNDFFGCVTSSQVAGKEFIFNGYCNRNKTNHKLTEITEFKVNCAKDGNFSGGDILKTQATYNESKYLELFFGERKNICHCDNVDRTSPSIIVDGTAPFKDKIEPEIFGSYQEEHWGDLTSGIYEQYLINSTFKKVWHTIEKDTKTRLLFREVKKQTGVSFPWNKVPFSTNSSFSISSEHSLNGETSQKISLMEDHSIGGVLQKLALPDRRVLTYNLKFWVRGTPDLSVSVGFIQDDNTEEMLSEFQVPGPIELYWTEVNMKISLPKAQSKVHRYTFGVANFAIIAKGQGELYLDQVTLIPEDAIEGKFNPTTIENLSKYKQTMIRWPGGNFTSDYHWKDGIGPLKDRPSKDNRVWGGIAANQFGTDEFLRFCELTGITPLISAGFDSEKISAQELAQWVEYVNGDEFTPMGRLRAKNGRTKPYNVKFWSVGNETYGSYQVGNTNEQEYADGLVDRIQAMKDIDPSISIAAVAYGLHNWYKNPYNSWTSTVLNRAGDIIDAMDVHSYFYGPKEIPVGVSQFEINRGLLASAHTFQKFYDNYRHTSIKATNGKTIPLVHYEWATLPSKTSNKTAARQTWLNAVITASHYNVMFRNSDLVKAGAFHNFSMYFNPVRAHSEPINPRTHVSSLYTLAAESKVLKTQSFEIPSYDMKAEISGVGSFNNVSEIDSVGAISQNGKRTLFMVNRSMDKAITVNTCFKNSELDLTANVTTMDSSDPFHRYDWSSNDSLNVRKSTKQVPYTNCQQKITLPPLSVTTIAR